MSLFFKLLYLKYADIKRNALEKIKEKIILTTVFQITQSTEFSYIPQKEDTNKKLNKRNGVPMANKNQSLNSALFLRKLIFASILCNPRSFCTTLIFLSSKNTNTLYN